MGRPDDGTDVSTFNNIEISVSLKPASQWRPHLTKPELIKEMNDRLSQFPGMDLNFSQNIQDNVEEAMSGVKGENSIKLFGDDFDTLTSLANKIQETITTIPGVADVGVFKVGGQPSLIIQIDRAKAARYGILSNDVNAAIQAAIGGAPISQVIQGDRRFDLTVRYPETSRSNPDAVRNILIPAADGSLVPLGQVADISIREGSFMIYREDGRRYIPIKFSVRGRDLATTTTELQAKLAETVKLPTGYNYTLAGEFDSLQKEQRRLAVIIPISLAIILVLLYIQFHTWRDALTIIAILPFAEVGGAVSLLHHPHLLQHLRRRRLHLAHRSSHPRRRSLHVRSQTRPARERPRRRTPGWLRRRDAPRRDGLPGSHARPASRRAVSRHRRAGPTASRPRSRRRNVHHYSRRPLPSSPPAAPETIRNIRSREQPRSLIR